MTQRTLQSPGDTDWFVHDRFGLFIHWGLYALAARHEWVKSREQIDDDTYDRRYFDRFDPDLFDPNAWADAAAGAGMKYVVVTTKHHDGFCLWDSQHTDYKATRTPYGRDVLRPMVDAFRQRGIRPGFYHSLLDWKHPHYVVDYNSHPRRGELPPSDLMQDDAMLAQAGGGKTKASDGPDPNVGRDHQKYIDYLHAQVRELLTKFGDIDVLWFDYSFTWHHDEGRGSAADDLRFNKGRRAWDSERLYAMIRELMPRAIVNDRLDLDLPLSGGDIRTPEQVQPAAWPTIEHEGRRVPVTWEACQTFSGSWGYHRDEHDWRSPRQLITTLIDSVSKGGNLLLNVGPNGRGEIDPRALQRLRDIGRWMRLHNRSIYGCTQAPDAFNCPRDCRLTWNPQTRRLYVHLLAWPYKVLRLDGELARRLEYAQLLHDASELPSGDAWAKKHLDAGDDVTLLRLPQREPEGVEIPVVELYLKDA